MDQGLIVKVKGYLTYRDVIGERRVQLRADIPVTLLDFIRELAGELGGEHGRALYDERAATVGPSVAIMLNGRHYNHHPEGLHTLLKDGDEVAVFPPGAGG
jgi:molybdopterin synthase sulfur carrier subunit